MSDNYPETLSIKYFINIPSWGETIYNLISRWLSEETRRKFIIVSKGNTTKALLENIDAAELYPSYRPKESEPSSSSSQSPSQSPPPAAAEPGQVAEEELMIPTDAAVGPAKDTNTVKATAITNDTHGLGGRKIDEPTTAAKGAADDSADKTSAS
ncbi:Non-classical phosphatidylinositol transfer protein (PITP) [Spiromyces aspiralis]|uniref:Non-classical phosphatidylinositol transfer protein (PITP) n=1 Tax=Spiromyces aspiralis TaxID=68401 RepID=A0ACC1HT90_9FUNG|nr:Non-classical phosphatidylinositol transfer protein (PITP) [Spiromyces aspiralis]